VKRFRRILFNTLTAISLILALATAGLWVRSYYVADLLVWYRRDGDFAVHHRIGFGCGGVTIAWVTGGKYDASTGWPPFEYSPLDALRTDDSEWDWSREARKRLSAFTWERTNFWTSPEMIPGANYLFQFPAWAPMLVLIVLPTLHLAVLIRGKRRTKSGLCPACGYDIRANPQRCSECGHEVATGPREPTAVNSPRASGELI
jgi:hypothetical protein